MKNILHFLLLIDLLAFVYFLLIPAAIHSVVGDYYIEWIFWLIFIVLFNILIVFYELEDVDPDMTLSWSMTFGKYKQTREEKILIKYLQTIKQKEIDRNVSAFAKLIGAQLLCNLNPE